jgi:hypothetical protein
MGLSATIGKNRVYILGGLNASGATDYVFSAVIAADGSIGTWEVYGQLPSPTYGGSLAVTAANLYIFTGKADDGKYKRVIGIACPGSTSDYLAINTGTYEGGDSALFRLPDYTFLEDKSIYQFIKT